MKFRMLSDDELKALEPELKQFLIVNGLHHEQWELLNHEEPDKAMALVELFSDTVLQKVYQKIEFLEHGSANNCLFFKLSEKEISLISIEVKPSAKIDLSSPEKLHVALTNNFNELNFYASTREFSQERETEIHQLLEQGCIVSSKQMWEALTEVLKD